MTEEWSARRTILSGAAESFQRPESELSLHGVLTPVTGKSTLPRTRIDGCDLLIGRGQIADGVQLQISDGNISRQHARISRVQNNFILEDLNSSNGTFLDGVPIRSALLHDGDSIQIGSNLVYFDHLFELDDQQRGDSSERITMRDWFARRRAIENRDVMSLRFWGTRGSLPTPGDDTRRHGGNTTCVELRYKDTIIVLDSGSGIREMSKAWAEEFSGQPIHASLCFTHLHWDHIQGFPFFGAAYEQRNSIHVYGAHREAGSTKELLSQQMQGDFFPIPLSAMRSGMSFLTTQREFSIGDVAVETFDLPHPSGSLGYRFSAGGSVFVMATDCELDQVAENHGDLCGDFLAPRIYSEEFLKPFRDVDLLVVDCQYTDQEYQPKVGWGHNAIASVVDFCSQVRPKMVSLFHHDPMTSDESIAERVKETSDRLCLLGRDDVLVFGAREQMTISVETPKRPPKIELAP